MNYKMQKTMKNRFLIAYNVISLFLIFTSFFLPLSYILILHRSESLYHYVVNGCFCFSFLYNICIFLYQYSSFSLWYFVVVAFAFVWNKLNSSEYASRVLRMFVFFLRFFLSLLYVTTKKKVIFSSFQSSSMQWNIVITIRIYYILFRRFWPY